MAISAIIKIIIDFIVTHGGKAAFQFCVATFGAFMGRVFYKVSCNILDKFGPSVQEEIIEKEVKKDPWYKRISSWFKKVFSKNKEKEIKKMVSVVEEKSKKKPWYKF